MDCCKTKNDDKCCKDSKKKNFDNESTNLGGGKMKTRVFLWGFIGVLFIAALFLTFKAGLAGGIETVQAATSTAGSAASGGMVGGC